MTTDSMTMESDARSPTKRLRAITPSRLILQHIAFQKVAKYGKKGIIHKRQMKVHPMATAAEGSDASTRPAYWHEDIKWTESNDPVIVDWERARRQIEHEDILINHRITWLVQTNAMLLAAFGGIYLIKSRISDAGNGAPEPSQESVSIGLLLLVLVVFGLLLVSSPSAA